MTTYANFFHRLGVWLIKSCVFAGFSFMMLPIILVIWLSFFSDTLLALPPSGYSFQWYGRIFDQPQFFNGFILSLKVATLATLTGLLVSIPASLALVRTRFRGQAVVLNLLTAPLTVPSIVIGAGLYIIFIEIEIFSGWPLVGATWGLGVAHVLITIPWCIRLITANLTMLDKTFEEAALSLGASPLVTLLRVTIPMIWSGIVAAALFSFVTSFGNLELSLFLVTPGETTLPIAILQYLQWKIDPTIAAVSVLQILVIGGGLMITDRFVSLSRVVR